MRFALGSITLLCLLGCCYGDGQQMQHLILLDQLPSQFSLDSSPQLIVRTNFSGFVDFKESEDFKVLLNVTAPSIEEAYAVTADITESKGRLLIQVFENNAALSPVSLPWIFIFIAVSTCLVIVLASTYAIWWYCSKKYLDLQRDYYSHGNVMFRSRNSECLSSGPTELLLQSEHGRDSMVDDGKDLPDVSEEDEDEDGRPIRRKKKTVVHHDESDEDNEKVDEKLTIKRRYQPPPKRVQQMRRHGRRKRHPSLNDPPSYDAVMEYPGGSSDESDDETNQKKTYINSSRSVEERSKREYVESSRSVGEQTSHGRDLYSYNPLAFKTIPVAHSDTELSVPLRSPRYVSHNIPPRGFVNPMERHENDYSENKDKKYEKILNSKESVIQGERAKTPVSKENRNRSTPRDELVQSPNNLERNASFRSNHSQSSRHERTRTPTSVGRTTPNHFDQSNTPSHYEQSNASIYSDRSNTPSLYARAKSPMDRNKTHIYAKAKKPPPLKLPPGIANSSTDTGKQNNLDETNSGYIELKSTSGPPIEKLTPVDQIDSINHSNQMDIPLTSFTGSLKKKRHKSKPETGESPKRNVLEGYNYNTLPTSPLSPKHPLNITGTSTINSQRFSVLSDNSISLYSSGEVYSPGVEREVQDEDDDDDETFDIEFEIPPVKQPDLDGLSEASLPLPSPPAYAKMPPGYSPRTLLPSPKPRPQPLSSLSHSIPVDEDMMSGTYIGLTASPTNTMDMIFQFPSPHRDSGISSERSLALSQGDNSPFTSPPRNVHPAQRELPPPPPRTFSPTQGYAWNGGRKTPDKGEYAKIKPKDEAVQENGEVKPRAGGGRKKPILKPKALHLAVICSISVLSLVTTVYSAVLPSQTQVHVTVYAPKSFLQREIQVFFNQNRPGEILNDQLPNIKAFDMADPYLRVMNSSHCTSTLCEHGCDENNGRCICKKGYRLDAKGVCQDVNECRSVVHRCHENADCLDREGSYQCHCSGLYYGDGKTCYECAAPCGDGTYEFQPCSQNQKKICLECTKECARGYYMTRRCHAQGDSTCRMCHKKCEKEEFESTRCTDVTNRVCRDRKNLAPPTASSNIIIENLRDVTKVNQEELFRPRGFHIDRGSGFFIKGSVNYFEPQITLHPVNHGKQNELKRFPGDQDLVNRYCPYPVPSYYELVKLTQLNMTYKSKTYGGKTYIEPCKTYTDHGAFPDAQQASRSILCSKPGPVTSIFDIASFSGESTPYWVEKNEKCVSKNAACLNCTKTCAKKMRLQGGDCGVTDKDNGRSPRLPLCMTCCADSNCTDLCEGYHDYDCQTEQCMVGDILSFELRPVFVNPEDVYCHMYPATNEKIAEINYKVMNYHNTLVSRSFVVKSDGSWVSSGKLTTGDEIVDIEVDSKVRQIPDFVKVLSGRREIEAGKYKRNVSSLSTQYTETKGLCRPDLPFSITSETFAKHSCDDSVLSNLLIATGLDEPFSKYPGKVYQLHNNYTFAVSSEDSVNLPNMKISISRKKSLLASLFPMATLEFENLLGNITHNATHWVVNLTGRIEKCPGVLGINLTDPGYPDEPLYQYIIKVTCPRKFDLSFGLPTGDKPFLDKEVVLSVKDKNYVHQLFVLKPASKKIYYTPGLTVGQMTSTKEPQKPSHFSIPFVASVVGIVMLLLFVTAFGMMVVFGQPTSDVLSFNWCHLVLMVGYISFQFLFAVCASMTVFVLVIVAVNSDTTAFLKNYQQQRSVKSAFTHLEMDHMERYLKTEIQRQNAVANVSKQECDQQMLLIIENLNDLQKEIEKNITDDIEKMDIRAELTKQISSLSQKFVSNIATFKEGFNKYIKFMEQKFSGDLQKTYRSIENNKWLATAQFLRRSVKNVRDLENLPTLPFTEWLGIPKDLTKLSLDKPIPVVKYPDFSDVFTPPVKQQDQNQQDGYQLGRERIQQYHNIWVTPAMALPNQTESQKGNHDDEGDRRNYDGYFVFFALMVVIDIVWFLHRMSKAIGVCSLILYGYPIYVDIREKTDTSQENEEDGNKKHHRWFKSGFCKSLKKFLLKVLVSMFVPKVIATIFVCLFVYMLSMATLHFVNRETFSYLGYYNNMDDMLRINEKFINRRIESHASRINFLQYPAYQELSNMYIQRHLHLYKLSEKHLHTIHLSHASFYCNFVNSLGVATSCAESLKSDIPEVIVSACQFDKISTRPYLRHTTSETNISDLQMDEFLFSIRKLIEDTCYIVLIFMSVVIIKELLGAVIWLYMKRSGFINLRIIFEADEPPNAPHK